MVHIIESYFFSALLLEKPGSGMLCHLRHNADRPRDVLHIQHGEGRQDVREESVLGHDNDDAGKLCYFPMN